MDLIDQFEAERARLIRLAARILSDHHEAHDVVQNAWLRLDRHEGEIDSLAAWLTTVTTRLCLDRLRARVPDPVDSERDAGLADELSGWVEAPPDPAGHAELAATVGAALQIVLERLAPDERVAFVMHDSFGFDFATIASALDTTPSAARKLASRARAKARQPLPEDELARWEVIDAFMSAARGGHFDQLLELLAPQAYVSADAAAHAAGTPGRIDGRRPIAEFFNGAAHAALPVVLDGRGGFAWFHRGEPRVVFDFDVVDGRVAAITFRAEPNLLTRVSRRPR